MAEDLKIAPAHAGKKEKYEMLIPQIKALIAGESSWVANLANVSAALKETFGWWWVGFYLVSDTELVLGPFQGPVACTRIRFGKGVCGTAWEQAASIIVPDVEQFPGHIACSSSSVAEIVVPVVNAEGAVVAVLDVDSERYDILDQIDLAYLEQLAIVVSACL